MKLEIIGTIVLGIVAATVFPSAVQANNDSFSGTIEQVWEDGFRLQSDSRTITVDSWDVCGDNTSRHLSAGEQVTVVGEFEDGEFDAFSITKADGAAACK
ncbi:hypothetical protein M595_3900 [Lyngbya aestuarii BL J]|uniref:DUF5666 domain-containing protein n=1 Tax=Lyngbya aestuarii BL J TaxID=1348334 RepID=U7QE70_9CYAN|nr:hypothetical protein [Lyngbya aestuarii]ERT06178.1 hypothetical protein M595_3900 [Lyngbya aestuarii BL J]